MKNKNPFKPPRPPRCLCRTYIDYLFGIVSPSLLVKFSFGPVNVDEVEKYFKKMDAYEYNTLQWKIQKRVETKTE